MRRVTEVVVQDGFREASFIGPFYSGNTTVPVGKTRWIKRKKIYRGTCGKASAAPICFRLLLALQFFRFWDSISLHFDPIINKKQLQIIWQKKWILFMRIALTWSWLAWDSRMDFSHSTMSSLTPSVGRRYMKHVHLLSTNPSFCSIISDFRRNRIEKNEKEIEHGRRMAGSALRKHYQQTHSWGD